MERFTISLDEDLAAAFDRLISERGYSNRSEAIRDLLRGELERARQKVSYQSAYCIGNLSYVYNHHERELAERLTALQHDHHDLTVSTMHAHLDHDNCIESVILRGRTSDVKRFADAIIAERGVRHGALNVVTAELDAGGGHSHPHPLHHAHFKPRS